MKQKDLLFIAAGVGVLYFLSRPTSAATYAPGVPVPPRTGPDGFPIPAGAGSLVSGFTNLISGLFGGGSVPSPNPSNPGINVVTNPGSYPSTPANNPGFTYDSGDPCDANSVQYNPDVCAELYPNG